VQLAVFGGSFDPVHIAHEAIVNEAIKELNIDKLVVVPTYLNPFKNSFQLEPKVREKILKKVFYNNQKIDICDYEIKQNRAVYSIETIKYLKNLYNPSKIYLIIGADNIKDLNKWDSIEELKSLVEFVVASRDGFIDNDFIKFRNLKVDINISSTMLRDKIDLNFIPIQIKEDIIRLQRNKKVNS
jgi:nicotinate-nucleotide adenylyltransferase